MPEPLSTVIRVIGVVEIWLFGRASGTVSQLGLVSTLSREVR